MRKVITAVMLLFALCMPVVGLSGQAAAVNIFGGICNGSQPSSGFCSDVNSGNPANGRNPIAYTIGVAVTVLSYIIGVAAIIGIIVNGIRMMTAAGDPNGVAGARTAIVYCLVGLAVAALTAVLVQVIISQLLS